MNPAQRVIVVRGIRSFTQAYLNVVAPLYLLSLGVSSAGLGVLFTASFLIGAALSVPVGIFADRFGRKPFLVAFTILMIIWGVIYWQSTYIPLLLAVSAIAGIGRGGGGMGAGQAGPFAPAETALLADLVVEEDRRRVFSWNGIVSSLLAAGGAAIAGIPELLHHENLGLLGSDKSLFLLTAILAVISLWILMAVPEPQRKPRVKGRRRPVSRKSGKIIVQQSLAGAFNAFGVGFVNSLFVVWLHLRFGVGSASIGPVFAASYLLSAASVWGASAFAGRVGSVRTIVITRIGAALLMVATALSPTFLIAVILQILRTAFTMMVTPVRQAFTMGLFPSEERASASGMTGVVRRLSAALSPPITGSLFEAGSLELPFFLGAAFQVVSAVLYSAFFARMDTERVGKAAIEEAEIEEIGREDPDL